MKFSINNFKRLFSAARFYTVISENYYEYCNNLNLKFKTLESSINDVRNSIDDVKNIIFDAKNCIDSTQHRIDDIYYNMQTLFMLQTFHSNIFPKFRGIYKDKTVVVFACGPSAKSYRPIADAIHIGVNFAFQNENIPFDYLFIQDNTSGSNINYLFDNYKNENCIKFYGNIPQRRLQQLPLLKHFSHQSLNQNNIFQYLLEDVFNGKWGINLECELFGDFGGTVFSVLQFVLYTNPKNIYLVGCDCDNSKPFYTSDNRLEYLVDNVVFSYEHHIDAYKTFKQYARQICPYTKIYSINPVGLKGIFEDIYY